ncbi:hypothetical protein [Micromonospora sp. ALFpr18c]|uniref:hypothetical protein n=1 Tax=Micromonospora sp. ALFpr18c TaxID=1458665 RepID=UPI001788CCAB|nr:hypothetical protein [Micromonospora sp. ALFpr18c]
MSRARFQQLQQESAQSRRDGEDQVLAAAAQIDPADNSLTARQILAAAESIRDHRRDRR